MTRRTSLVVATLLLLSCLRLQFTNANTNDTFRPSQSLNTTDLISSANGLFSLRFRDTVDGKVLCVETNMDNQIIWIANREQPFVSSSAVLAFNREGNLVISDGRSSHTVTNIPAGNDTYSKLLDTGNLILTNRASDVLWQSFDYPFNILIPGMKLKDAKTGWSFVSMISHGIPGPFSLHLGSRKELILMNGSEPYWSSPLVDDLAAIFVIDGEYVTWSRNYTNITTQIQFDRDGNLDVWRYTKDQNWKKTLLSKCAGNNVCGPIGDFKTCNETADSLCDCLPGFNKVGSECVREKKLQCSDGTNVQQASFHRISRVVLPTNPQRLQFGNTSDCKSACLRNCSCTGYAYDQEDYCLVWYDTLVNLKQLSAADIGYKTDFYLKLALQDAPEGTKKHQKPVTW